MPGMGSRGRSESAEPRLLRVPRRARIRPRPRGWRPALIFDRFPDPRLADAEGLVGLGGDFSPEMLVEAYSKGIFPWPSDEIDRVWFSPDPRMVLRPREVHVSRSLQRTLNSGRLELSFDRAFGQVIEACSRAQGRAEAGTWIVDELRTSFLELHRRGLAHSVEVWRGSELVGGLYGLSLGAMFCGESMFHTADDASKLAFVGLARQLAAWDFLFLDCQVYSEHLARLGAREWPRDTFLNELEKALARPTLVGDWGALARVGANC